jgi:outer membrane protein OmpA-like peptidoglycan-associated protein
MDSKIIRRGAIAASALSIALAACGGNDAERNTQATTVPPPQAAPLPPRPTEAEQFAERVVNIGGVQSNDAVKLTLAGDRFAAGQGEFQAGDKIDAVAQLMKNHPESRVLIEGFTDDRGGNALNQRLSEQRARSVHEALVARGIDASRIEVAGRGPAQPVASNDTAEGRAQNRRVELTFSAEGANQLASAPAAAPGG